MASTTRIARKGGTSYKAIISVKHRGQITKTFKARKRAVEWARNRESDA